MLHKVYLASATVLEYHTNDGIVMCGSIIHVANLFPSHNCKQAQSNLKREQQRRFTTAHQIHPSKDYQNSKVKIVR